MAEIPLVMTKINELLKYMENKKWSSETYALLMQKYIFENTYK